MFPFFRVLVMLVPSKISVRKAGSACSEFAFLFGPCQEDKSRERERKRKKERERGRVSKRGRKREREWEGRERESVREKKEERK